MKKLLPLVIALIFCSATYSQRVYFVYLQTENKQPFYAKKGDAIYSSSSSGYLILSKLIDSTYDIIVGFPNNQWPEQIFPVKISKSDHGFLLKNFGEKGWGLFDLKTLTIQMSGSHDVKPGPSKSSENKGASSFANILSKASDDPALNEKPVRSATEPTAVKDVIEEKKTVEKKEPLINRDTVVVPPTAIVEGPVAKPGPVAVKEDTKETSVSESALNEEYKKTTVTKKSESSTTQGFGLVYTDEKNGIADTIRLLIPNPAVSTAAIKEEPKKEEKKFLEMAVDTTAKTTEMLKLPVAEPVKETTVPAKPTGNCTVTADDNDFFKLRKQMASAEGDDAMINEARKYFKTKCFTVQQLKNLGILFLTDEGKYRFFDQAYSYVSDVGNFAVLQSELKDEYYINRFKAMLRN